MGERGGDHPRGAALCCCCCCCCCLLLLLAAAAAAACCLLLVPAPPSFFQYLSRPLFATVPSITCCVSRATQSTYGYPPAAPSPSAGATATSTSTARGLSLPRHQSPDRFCCRNRLLLSVTNMHLLPVTPIAASHERTLKSRAAAAAPPLTYPPARLPPPPTLSTKAADSAFL